MLDKPMTNFLECQISEGRELAACSDILRLLPVPGRSPQQYVSEFRCRGLVQSTGGQVGEGGLFIVSIFFPSDYLRRAVTPEVLTWLGPTNAYHPNILGPAGAICIGKLEPGTSLVDLLYQIYEIITFRKFNAREWDCLNRAACSWARNHQHLFPTDPRPLRRPRLVRAAPGQEAGVK